MRKLKINGLEEIEEINESKVKFGTFQRETS